MEFKVKTVSGKDLEDTLNNYEPYKLKLISVVPDVGLGGLGAIITDYKIIYRVVPDEELRESSG